MFPQQERKSLLVLKRESQSEVFTTDFIIESIGIENQLLIVNARFILENLVVYSCLYVYPLYTGTCIHVALLSRNSIIP